MANEMEMANLNNSSGADTNESIYNFSREQALDIAQQFLNGLFTIGETRTIVLILLYIPIFIISFVGNSLIIFVVCRNTQLKRVWY